MRALVLGGTGHIGSHIIQALVTRGYAVRAMCRDRSRITLPSTLPVEWVEGDTRSDEWLRRAVDGCAWVFHAAGYYPPFSASVQSAVEAGVADVRRVMDVFRRVGVGRVVFTSSSSTIRRVPGRLATEADWESDPLDHHRPLYPTVKIAMEQEALRAAANLPVIIVNPTLCLGEYDAKPFSSRMITIVAQGLPCYVEHRLNVVYTGDVGLGHVLAAERGVVGERYLLGGHNILFSELAAVIARAAGVTPPRRAVPYGVVYAVALLGGWWWRLIRAKGEFRLPAKAVEQVREGQFLDGSRAIRELGMPQTPVEEAVRRAVAWMRARGMV